MRPACRQIRLLPLPGSRPLAGCPSDWLVHWHFAIATLMRDIYQLLYCKERQLQRLRKEIEVLKIVIPLLEDDGQAPAMPVAAGVTIIPFERAARAPFPRFPSALSD
jgi:hypothetical protein